MEHMRPFLAAAAVLTPLLLMGAQHQQPSAPRRNWPCGGRLDPSYFQVAEGTGGHLLLLSPEEIEDSTALLTAFESHHHTIFRLAGSLTPGPHDFRVPIDPSVESVLFSASVQCLETFDVLRPSGVSASGDGVTLLSNFRAERMVIVLRPEPGVWTVSVSGSGMSGVVVQARSAIGVSDVRFAPAGSSTFTALPAAGVENVVRIRLGGQLGEVQASLVNGAFARIARLPLEADDTDGSYRARFTPGRDGFRVLIAGKDSEGNAVQRMYAPLIATAR
jgi:hypothetical protein